MIKNKPKKEASNKFNKKHNLPQNKNNIKKL